MPINTGASTTAQNIQPTLRDPARHPFEQEGAPPVGSPGRVFLLTVVIVADPRGLASDPQFVNADNIGVLEHLSDPHIDPCAWRCLT